MGKTNITKIQITEGACAWGPDSDEMSDAEVRERQSLYEALAAVVLAAAYPGVDISHDVDSRSDARRRIVVRGPVDAEMLPICDEEGVADYVHQILGDAWRDACEATL